LSATVPFFTAATPSPRRQAPVANPRPYVYHPRNRAPEAESISHHGRNVTIGMPRNAGEREERERHELSAARRANPSFISSSIPPLRRGPHAV
jgi:hypothetical protein